ncbi:receptor-type tyrosine-protein phosphatase F [Penaeus vannamei]|uniref:receptor-type tyrosine-protein phosphatase F n=1 Tax=Penaeus vannamei TaxID=6689 RepID=UPI00387F7588
MVDLKIGFLIAAVLTVSAVAPQEVEQEEYEIAEASCAPANVTAECVPDASDSLYVTWEEPNPLECDVTHYTVSWLPIPGKDSWQQEDTNDTQITLGGLDFYRSYNVCVEAHTNTSVAGAGDLVCDVGTTDKPECPAQEAAANVTVSEVPPDPRQLHVAWDIPATATYCPIDHIRLTYREKENLTTGGHQLSADVTDYTIGGLRPCTLYEVSVIAVINEAGVQDETWNVGVTGVAIPGPPGNVIADLAFNKSDSLYVTWEEPNPLECDVTYYTVSCQPVSGSVPLPPKDTNTTQMTVTGLDPFRSYNVCVAAHTGAGAGDLACDIGTTDEAVPGAPVNLAATATTPESILVSWATPEDPNGVITNYSVSWECAGGNSASAVVGAAPYNITGLSPCSSCAVAVRAATAKGFGNATVLEATSGKAPPPQPLEASCSSTPPAEHSIVVTWSAPNTFCNVSAYNVTYIGDVLWSDEEQVGTLQTSEEMASLSSLTSWTKYHVCVAGIVLDDFVGEQSCCDAVTQEAASGPPALFNVSGTSSSSISVFWEEPRAPNGKIDYYQLQFGGESVQVENATEFTLTGLAKNSKYIISLKAHNGAGLGEAATTTATTQKAANVGAIVAAVLSGLLIVGVGVAAFIYRDKLRNVIARKTSKREPVQEHPLSTTSTAVGKDQLRSYIDGLQEDTQRGLEEEFARLKQQCPKPSTYDAEMDVNKPKNRFSNILAYDHSRVRISRREGAAQSDYINANFIKDHAGRPGFVATQGPTEDTLDDFWRLVWEQKVYTVVMLTSLMEKGKLMCTKYWPNKGDRPLQCDNFQIRNLEEAKESLYVSRMLEVNTGHKKRIVKHYHFLAWPDFGTPDLEEDLLGFIATVRDSSTARPVVVHCRAGVGRTGTFIGLWNLMDAVDARPESNIDVYQAVFDMRKDRPIMVQSIDQYLYLYKCIATYIEQPEKWSNQGSDHIYENKGFEDAIYENVD